jgi:hypothetical protein
MAPLIRRLTIAAILTGSTGVNAYAAEPGQPPPTWHCVRSWPEARYRNYGYDHIVHVINGCVTRVTCQVASDVSPAVITVTIPAREQSEVITFVGSPARSFTPKVLCKLTPVGAAGSVCQ